MAVFIAAHTVDLMQVKLDQVMGKICSWIAVHGLLLTLSKSEIMVLTTKRIPNILHLRVGDMTVEIN